MTERMGDKSINNKNSSKTFQRQCLNRMFGCLSCQIGQFCRFCSLTLMTARKDIQKATGGGLTGYDTGKGCWILQSSCISFKELDNPNWGLAQNQCKPPLWTFAPSTWFKHGEKRAHSPLHISMVIVWLVCRRECEGESYWVGFLFWALVSENLCKYSPNSETQCPSIRRFASVFESVRVCVSGCPWAQQRASDFPASRSSDRMNGVLMK